MLTRHTGKAQFWAIFQQISMFLGFLPSFFFTDRGLCALVAAWGWLCGAYASLSHLTHGLWGEEVLALTSLPLDLLLRAVGWEQVASQGCLQQFRHRDSNPGRSGESRVP